MTTTRHERVLHEAKAWQDKRDEDRRQGKRNKKIADKKKRRALVEQSRKKINKW